jgi:hypothetical protein
MTRRWTIAILISVVVGLVAWDIYAYVATGPSATISRVALDFAGRHPVFILAVGVLLGHLFWPQTKKVKSDG